MAQSQRAALVEGKVSAALVRMALPMALGMVFMIAVNLIDTYWVSRIATGAEGTRYVAAMTYTFPVVGLIINIALGFMIGTSTAVARAIGAEDEPGASRLTTHALVMALMMVALVTGLGLATQDAVFRLLGAEGEILALTKRYMTIWYVGNVFLTLPLILNGVLRARGDARTPMLVMMLGAVANAVLDPLLIFGWGPVAPMGFEGAAIATLLARVIGMLYMVSVLVRRPGILRLKRPLLSGMRASLRSILSVGVPAAITNALGPVAVALVTGLIASYGPSALAAYGVGVRLDAIVMMVPMAVGGALSPFIGQNWGAHLLLRVGEGLRQSLTFVLLWGVAGCVFMLLVGPRVAPVFTDDPKVIQELLLYFQTIPVGYAFLGVSSVASSAFNAVDRAFRSTWLSLLRSLIIAVPAAYIGGHFAGLRGVFFGLVSASVVAAFLGAAWLKTLLNPDGEISPEVGKPVEAAAVGALMADARLSEFLSAVIGPVLSLEGMDARRLRSGLVGFFVGRRELAHIHPEGRMDLPLPPEIGANLVLRGVVEPHPGHEDNGWYVHRIDEERHVEETVWLLRLAHLLYEVSRRGVYDPITQDEMEAFTATERCVAAMKASAKRWEPNSALLDHRQAA